MSTLLKRFSSIDELKEINQEEYEKYSCFAALNKSIEDEYKSYDYIRESYQKVYLDILGGEGNESEYREFHYHIKYAMSEMKDERNRSIPVNRVREFIEAKFQTYRESSMYLLEKSEFLGNEEKNALLEYIKSNKDLYITILVSGMSPYNWDYSNEFHIDTTLSDRDLYGSIKDFVDDIDKKISKEAYVLAAKIKTVKKVSR